MSGSARRLLLILALDQSGSMRRTASGLPDALGSWLRSVRVAPDLRHVLDLAVVVFGKDGVHGLDPETGARDERLVAAPIARWTEQLELHPEGHTPLDAALERVLDFHRDWLAEPGRERAYAPVLWIVTDGAPSTEDRQPDVRWRRHLTELRQRERAGRLTVFVARPDRAELATLDDLAPGAVVPLDIEMSMLLALVSRSAEATRAGSSAAARVRQVLIDLGLADAA